MDTNSTKETDKTEDGGCRARVIHGSGDNDWDDEYHHPWTCGFCGQQFDWEVDIEAHQFNGPCEGHGT